MSSDLLEELEVLESIYAYEISYEVDNSGNYILKYINQSPHIIVTFIIPTGYPSQQSPTFTVKILDKTYAKSACMLENSLASVIADNFPNVVLFSCIQSLKDMIDSNVAINEDNFDEDDVIYDNDANEYDFSTYEHTSQVNKSNSKHNYESQSSSNRTLNVIHGPTTEISKSTFQSHIAEVHSMKDVFEFKEIVLSDKKTARATHNIFAYRFTDSVTGIIHHDNDDDGETAAGSRLGEMLRLMNVTNIAVIVSRVFGGVKLGPHRFKYICNSARKLIEEDHHH